MHKIRNSLIDQQTPHTSIGYSYSKSIVLQQFAPFSKERDTLGRLLKPALSAHVENSEKGFYVQRELKESPFVPSKLQQKMNKYFKQNGLSNLAVELGKNEKKKKKSLLNILLTEQKTVNRQDRDEEVKIKQKQSLRMRKIQSSLTEWSPAKPKTAGRDTRNKKGLLIPRCQSSITVTKSIIKNDEMSVFGKRLKPRNEGLSLQNCQQLNLYHKRQQLQIKMQTTFEEGHLRFIGKMRQSKKLAQEIKYNIQQIDNYC